MGVGRLRDDNGENEERRKEGKESEEYLGVGRLRGLMSKRDVDEGGSGRGEKRGE